MALADSVMPSGVFMSCSPPNTPCPTVHSMTAGAASARTIRNCFAISYVAGDPCGSAPMTSRAASLPSSNATVNKLPHTVATISACSVTMPARVSFLDALARATSGVVAVPRKLNTRNENVNRAELMPSAASASGPACPTNAVSTTCSNGSAASANAAGSANVRICLSSGCRPGSAIDEKEGDDADDGSTSESDPRAPSRCCRCSCSRSSTARTGRRQSGAHGCRNPTAGDRRRYLLLVLSLPQLFKMLFWLALAGASEVSRGMASTNVRNGRFHCLQKAGRTDACCHQQISLVIRKV